MFNFFADENCRNGDKYFISGSDFNHMKNVLRMHEGDEILVSDSGFSHLCIIESFEDGTAVVSIAEENFRNTELPVSLILFQGLPKADKLELIIQKAVELGIAEITPVEMNRCVVKLDEKKKSSKQARWQSIAESAAKQSKRNIIPKVNTVISFRQLIKAVDELDLFLVPYENKDGMAATRQALGQIKPGMTVGILIGPEGGFDDGEISAAIEAGGKSISLGSRILRTETAAVTAVGMCMLHIEMNGESK